MLLPWIAPADFGPIVKAESPFVEIVTGPVSLSTRKRPESWCFEQHSFDF